MHTKCQMFTLKKRISLKLNRILNIKLEFDMDFMRVTRIVRFTLQTSQILA